MGLFDLFRTLIQNQVFCVGDLQAISYSHRYEREQCGFDHCQQQQHLLQKNVIVSSLSSKCSSLLLQQETDHFSIYLKLKQEERHAAAQLCVAISIQSSWRGPIIRNCFKLVLTAIQIIKIQALFVGVLTRRKQRLFFEERRAKCFLQRQAEAAKKIQAAWRGYSSRKTKFNFTQYKSIQAKNEALKRSIDRINELETALLKSLESRKKSQECFVRTRRTTMTSSSSLSKCVRKNYVEKGVTTIITSTTEESTAVVDHSQSTISIGQPGSMELTTITERTENSFCSSLKLDNMTPSQENIVIDMLPELVGEMSESRIAELYAYLANLETEMNLEKQLLLERQVRKLGGIQNLNAEQLYRLEESRRKQRERANRILDLAKLEMMGPLKRKFVLKQKEEDSSVDADAGATAAVVFSAASKTPERPDVVRPPHHRTKVNALKDAIRLFRQKGHVKEEWELKKNHFLLRTRQCPGVYSDIYTTELTEMEKRLKAVKFWKGSMAAERIRKKREMATTNSQRLRRLFTHALRISERKSNNGTADDEEESEDEEEALVTTADDYNDYSREEMGLEDDDDLEEEGVSEATEKKLELSCCSNSSYYIPPPLEPLPPPPTPAAAAGDDLNTNATLTSGEEPEAEEEL